MPWIRFQWAWYWLGPTTKGASIRWASARDVAGGLAGDVGEFPQTRWLGDLRVGLELDGTQDLVLPQGVALRGEVRLPPELIDSLVEIQVWKADRSSAQGTRPLARWVGTPGRFQIERLPVGEVLVRLLESEEVQAEQRFWLDRDHAELPTFDFGSWSAYEAWLAGVQPR
ncbi:MAG: hypothetical protein H6827_09125 [Planctomycetes bacterium]|nr:hypothetical protein [Planctomycetota bacterium]